jgi:hypothetical protein
MTPQKKKEQARSNDENRTKWRMKALTRARNAGRHKMGLSRKEFSMIDPLRAF